MIVVFEGIDGSGKDTQIDMLLGALSAREKTFKKFKFPTQKARLALAHLDRKSSASAKDLFSDFARDIESSTQEILDSAGKFDFIVIDRYIFSTLAYQGVALGLDSAMELAGKFRLARPDLVIYLKLAPELAYSRKSAQKEMDRFESDLSFQIKVAGVYDELCGKNYNSGRWASVDASKAPGEVHGIIIKEVMQE